MTLVKSLDGRLEHRRFRARLRPGAFAESVLVKDTRENRGMINAAVHLLRVDEKGA